MATSGHQVFDRRIMEEHLQRLADERLREKIEESLLTDEEMLGIIEQASLPCPMEFRDEPKVRAIAQAQVLKTLKALEV